jgi:hypothetical protein
MGSRRLDNLYENAKGFKKKNPKNSFYSKISEIFALTKPHVELL